MPGPAVHLAGQRSPSSSRPFPHAKAAIGTCRYCGAPVDPFDAKQCAVEVIDQAAEDLRKQR